MTSSIHPAQQIRARYRKYQVIALCCTIITVVAALLAALSGLQLTHLRAEREKAIANMPAPAPIEPILQRDPVLEKELETAVQRLAEAQRQMATERENVRKLMARIAELERLLIEATNRINQLEKERSAAPPPPKTEAPPAASAPAPPKQPQPIAAPAPPSQQTTQPPPQIHGIEKPAQIPSPVMPAAVTEPAPEQVPGKTQSDKPSTEGVTEPAISIAPRPQEPEPSPPRSQGLPETSPGPAVIQAPAPDAVHSQPSAEQETLAVPVSSEIQEAPGRPWTPGLIEKAILPAQNE
jgi:hypothetical protein